MGYYIKQIVMRNLLGIYLFFLFLSTNILAQGFLGLEPHLKERPVVDVRENEISTLLRQHESYRNIAQKISHSKKGKNKRSAFSVGDTSSFYVRDIQSLTNWASIRSVCKYKSDRAAIWISEDDIVFFSDSLDIQDIIGSLHGFLEFGSLSGPAHSSKGILDIGKEYFGELPDVDRDGILDILLLDIQDSFQETGNFVTGFFDPVDLIEHEFSNQRDLLYIDIFPTLFYAGGLTVHKAASTIAHELQHLIHAHYETENRQYTFINEGLSEYAEVLNGFSPRNPEPYYKDSNRALFSWNYSDPIPDYVRSSLFFTYLFGQIGPDKAKHLVQDRTGIGHESVLELIQEHSVSTFDEIFRAWGLALLGAQGENLDFKHPDLQNVRPSSARINSLYPAVSNIEAAPLSHSFFYSVLTNELEPISNQHINASAWAEYPSGVTGPVQTNTGTFEANAAPHGSLWVLFSNTEAQVSESGTTNSVQSVLFVGEKSGQVEALAYDDGIPDTFLGNASFLQLTDLATEVAVIVSSSKGFWLSEVSLKTVFRSELSGSGIPATSPRDVRVQIYSVKNKVPDQPLTPAFVHTFDRPFGNLKFESISLSPFYDQLSVLGDSVAIVIKNDEDDENHVALGMDFSGTNHAAKKNSDGSWSGFEDVNIGNVSLSGWNPMVRATSIISEPEKDRIVPVIALTDSELLVEFNINEEIDSVLSRSMALSPSGLAVEGTPDYGNGQFGEARYSFPIQVGGAYTIVSTLSGASGAKYESSEQWQVPENADFKISNNYPNPFNPGTKVPFLLLEAGRVGVTVYDILGRKVLSVPERFYAAGNQLVQLDFAGLASGTYILKMDVNRPGGRGALTRTRKVTFVK